MDSLFASFLVRTPFPSLVKFVDQVVLKSISILNNSVSNLVKARFHQFDRASSVETKGFTFKISLLSPSTIIHLLITANYQLNGISFLLHQTTLEHFVTTLPLCVIPMNSRIRFIFI